MALSDEVKTMLDIVECDNSTEQKIKLIIAEAKQHLRSFCPNLNESDFEDNRHRAKFLLLSYCRYAFSNAAEMFDENYKSELLNLRAQYNANGFDYEETED